MNEDEEVRPGCSLYILPLETLGLGRIHLGTLGLGLQTWSADLDHRPMQSIGQSIGVCLTVNG